TPSDSNRWFVFDDRQMYRPNEEVSVKGYLRRVTGGKFSDIAEFGESKTINYILKDARYTEILRGTANINQFGAFDFKLKLPENINLGYQRLEFWSREISNYPEFTHNFQVQEFRRPEFEVTVAAETPAPYFVGNSAVFGAEAKYYTGGFLANSDINWRVAASQTNYSPPNHESYIFGEFIPWWRSYSEYSLERSQSYGNSTAQFGGGTTGANGKHRINLDFLSANPARPYNLSATAEVQDVNRQTIADTKTFIVHPSEVYVGLRTAKTFVRQNEAFRVETIATDIDGKTLAGAPIEINAVLKDWVHTAGSWQEVVIDTQNCKLVSAAEPVSCDFTAKKGGTYLITATVLDAKERPNTSVLTVWAAGGNMPPKRDVEKQEAELIPGKKEYAPGEQAEILVNAPFFPAEGVMTLERAGIVKTERFSMTESSTVLQIPIEERYLPNVSVKVDLVGTTARTDDKGVVDKSAPERPAFASGELNLNVSTASRKLNVTVEPFAQVTEPGKETKIKIDVKDAAGRAVRDTEVALVAVDESVLALTNYKIQNPLDAFYQQLAPGVTHYHSREKIVLSKIQTENASLDLLAQGRTFTSLMQVAETVSIDGSRADVKENYKRWVKKDVAYIITEKEKSALNIRRNFDALAIFSPSVKTDASGKATVAVKLPDNLTRYRITAVAVTKSKQFGLGESTLTARQPLQVRPSAPRFMNFTDKAELPVVLQNQSDAPVTVNVAIRAANAKLTGGSGRRIT
ncbi:MAG TPA: alpha-2-macroglobulin family protein, partial [Pyrinomonadaceae bacterium]